MQKTSKPSGEKAISWLSGPVRRARVRLTGIYLALPALVFVVMGLTTRYVFEQRLQRRFVLPQPIVAQLETGEIAIIRPKPEDLRQDLIDTLLGVNLGTFFGAAALAYVLSGLTLRPVEAAAARERRFISHASHELRTPLAILQTELEANAMDATPEERSRIESYLEEVHRLRMLTDSLLGQQSSTSQRENIHLATFIEEQIARVAELAKEHQVIMAPRTIDQSLSLTTAPLRLSIVLQNILQNAIRYNKQEGSVDVTAAREGQSIVITIADTGIGIPQEDIARVTERFYRVQRAQPAGTGLGLALSKEIVEELGGQITFVSKEGEGTRVSVVLPAA